MTQTLDNCVHGVIAASCMACKVAKLRPITKREKEIVTRLAKGGRLQAAAYANNVYLLTPSRQTVNKATLLRMQKAGLLRVGRLPGEYRTEFLPTREALAALGLKDYLQTGD